MRKPLPTEFIICPNSRFHSRKHPKGVFDTIDPNGKKASFGIIDAHRHGFMATQECEWTGLAVKLEEPVQFAI